MNVWDFGDNHFCGKYRKTLWQFFNCFGIEAIGESVNLASSSGVDAQQMWNMLIPTLFNAPVYINYSNIILQQKFEPAAFSMKLGLKDMNLVLQQAAVN